MAGHELGTITLTGGPEGGTWTITAHNQAADVVVTTQGDVTHHEIGTITLTDGSTGGTWTITTEDGTTSALPYNETGANVQIALRAVGSVWAAATVSRAGAGTRVSPYVYSYNSGANNALGFTDLTTTATSLTKTTSALAYNVAGAATQTALRDLATGWGAATIVRSGTGTSADPNVYTFDSGANGALVDLTTTSSLTFSETFTFGGEFI